jgi:hypothetical protein
VIKIANANNNIKQNSTDSLFSKVVDAGKKVVQAGLVSALLAIPVKSTLAKNPHNDPNWLPPGQEKKLPSPAFPEVQYDQLIDWFLYEATPVERDIILVEYGDKMPELYDLNIMASYVNQ